MTAKNALARSYGRLITDQKHLNEVHGWFDWERIRKSIEGVDDA